MSAPPVSWRGFGLMFLDGLAGLLPRGWRRAELKFAAAPNGGLAVDHYVFARDDGEGVVPAQPLIPAEGFRALLGDAATEWAGYEPDWDRRVVAARRHDGTAEVQLGATAIQISREEDESRTWTDLVLDEIVRTQAETARRDVALQTVPIADGRVDGAAAEFVCKDGARLPCQLVCVWRPPQLHWAWAVDCQDALRTELTALRDAAEAGPDAPLFCRSLLVWHASQVRPIAWLAALRMDARGLIEGHTPDGLVYYAIRGPAR